MDKICRAIPVAVSGCPPTASQTSKLSLENSLDPSPECARCSEDMDTLKYLSSNRDHDHDDLQNYVKSPTDYHGRERLDNGIALGCWWCINIWERLKTILSITDTDLSNASSNTSRNIISICFGLFSDLNTSLSVTIQYQQDTIRLYVSIDHGLNITPIASLGRSTNLVESLDYVASRISHCKKNHKQCGQTARWIPTRLLRIHEDCGRFSLRVVIRDDVPVGSKYATLSHRWGHDESQLLADIRGQGFPMIHSDNVPTLFAQAAMVVHHIGIKYMWIDSLVRNITITLYIYTDVDS